MNSDPDFRQARRDWWPSAKYKGPQPFHRRLGWLVGLLIAAGILILFVGRGGTSATVGICVAGAGAALLAFIAFAEVAYQLFFREQMRLVELLALVAVLGNAIGGLYGLYDAAPHKDESAWVIPVFFGPLLVLWIMAGAAWGLWVARVKGVTAGWKRIGLMALGWAFAPALFGCLGFLLEAAVQMDLGNTFKGVFCFAGFFACAGAAFWIALLHQSAQRTDRENAALPPPPPA